MASRATLTHRYRARRGPRPSDPHLLRDSLKGIAALNPTVRGCIVRLVPN